ncbi:LysR family transcriptional regulator [Psychromonas sp. KJ10-10]
MQKLEDQLQVTIFQKQGRRAVLTPAGKIYSSKDV